MLEEGDQVEENGDVSQRKLGGICKDRAPVTTLGGVYEELDERKDGPGEVEGKLEDAKPPGRLAPDVEPYLRRVFDHGEEGLHVPHEVNL